MLMFVRSPVPMLMFVRSPVQVLDVPVLGFVKNLEQVFVWSLVSFPTPVLMFCTESEAIAGVSTLTGIPIRIFVPVPIRIFVSVPIRIFVPVPIRIFVPVSRLDPVPYHSHVRRCSLLLVFDVFRFICERIYRYYKV